MIVRAKTEKDLCWCPKLHCWFLTLGREERVHLYVRCSVGPAWESGGLGEKERRVREPASGWFMLMMHVNSPQISWSKVKTEKVFIYKLRE